MTAYLIVDIEVIDHKLYAEYVEKVPATIRAYGGRYLARGGTVRVLAGDWRPERIILVEFPSIDLLQQWLASTEYAALQEIRERSTRGRAVMIEGIENCSTA